MSALENKVFDTTNRPNIYLKYADDIRLLTIVFMQLIQYKRPFKIILFSILHKKSTSTIKFHFFVF